LCHRGDTSSHDSDCTAACTSAAETANAGTIEALAAAILTLSAADRTQLAALLIANPATAPGDGHGSPNAAGRPAGNAEGLKAT
jgi:hypothetical protein